MKNIKQVIKNLQSKGFKTESGSGSRLKIIPPNKAMEIYSLHIDNTGKAYFPLKRFARKNWGIQI